MRTRLAQIVNPDSSIAPGSKVTVDVRTLASDQSMRDGYLQNRTLETAKFPMMEVVPKRTVGLPPRFRPATRRKRDFSSSPA